MCVCVCVCVCVSVCLCVRVCDFSSVCVQRRAQFVGKFSQLAAMHLSAIQIQRSWRCYQHKLLQQRVLSAAIKLQVSEPSCNVFPKYCVSMYAAEGLVQNDSSQTALQEVIVISKLSSAVVPQ